MAARLSPDGCQAGCEFTGFPTEGDVRLHYEREGSKGVVSGGRKGQGKGEEPIEEEANGMGAGEGAIVALLDVVGDAGTEASLVPHLGVGQDSVRTPHTRKLAEDQLCDLLLLKKAEILASRAMKL